MEASVHNWMLATAVTPGQVSVGQWGTGKTQGKGSVTETDICNHLSEWPEQAKSLQVGCCLSSFPTAPAWTLPHLPHGGIL